MPHPSRGSLTPPYINAIIRCITSSEKLIETFLDMRYVRFEFPSILSSCHCKFWDQKARVAFQEQLVTSYLFSTFTNLNILHSVQEIRGTPTLVYVRLVYAIVILIKLSISTSTTELGEVLRIEDLKVSFYLEKLLAHLSAVATLNDQETHTLADKFVQILTKVKAWFEQQGRPYSSANDGIRPPAGSGPSRSIQMKREDHPHYTDKFNLLTNFSKAPTMNTTVWPDQFQSSNDYSDPNYSLQPSWNDVAFDFPMDLDPNLFTHLIQADQTQNYQNSETSNVEAYNQIDYLNTMPDFGGWPMQ